MSGDLRHPFEERLSEYVDETLEANERAAVEAHLASCEACRTLVEELRAVVLRATALGGIEPERDLWRGIAARIGAGAAPAPAEGGTRAGEPASVPDVAPAAAPVPIARHPRWPAMTLRFTLPQVAAAAVLIAALSAGGAWWITRHAGPAADRTPLAAVDPGATDAANASGDEPWLGDAGYQATIADLEKTLESGRDRLDPETVKVLRTNLGIIDQAIADSRRALEADPESPYLYRHLNRQMQRKVDLLQQATVYAYAGN